MTCTVIGQGNAGRAPRTMGDTRPRTDRSACPNALCGAGKRAATMKAMPETAIKPTNVRGFPVGDVPKGQSATSAPIFQCKLIYC